MRDEGLGQGFEVLGEFALYFFRGEDGYYYQIIGIISQVIDVPAEPFFSSFVPIKPLVKVSFG